MAAGEPRDAYVAAFSEGLRKAVAATDEQILRGVADWDEYTRAVGKREGLLAAADIAKTAWKATEGE